MLFPKLLWGNFIISPRVRLTFGILGTPHTRQWSASTAGGPCWKLPEKPDLLMLVRQRGAGWGSMGPGRPAQGQGLTVMGSFSTRSPFRPFPVSILWYKWLFSGNMETPRGLLRVHDSPAFTVGTQGGWGQISWGRISWGTHKSLHPRLLRFLHLRPHLGPILWYPTLNSPILRHPPPAFACTNILLLLCSSGLPKFKASSNHIPVSGYLYGAPLPLFFRGFSLTVWTEDCGSAVF